MSKGRFGIHCGQYIPETLMNAVNELEEAYNHYKDDPEFQAELTELLNEYAGRPSRLYYARRMTEDLTRKGYVVERMTGVDLFPMTKHCEVVCGLSRK